MFPHQREIQLLGPPYVLLKYLPTPSEALSSSHYMVSDDFFQQIGETEKLLDDLQLSLSPIPVYSVEFNPMKNRNLEVLSYEGFSPDEGTMTEHYEDVSPFLSVTEIGTWKVKCHLSANQISSVGAIGPFGEDTSREELTETLIDADFEEVTVKRVYKNKDKTVTVFFKMVFRKE
ncbi:hypothetical protein FHG87_016463 [Trinorchestia longiramus]|nr:hypothetical protein FHG87_016463 [Trinorchestia longiramus]